jgi:hypothetical protein
MAMHRQTCVSKWVGDALFGQQLDFYLGKKIEKKNFQGDGPHRLLCGGEGRLTNDSMGIKVRAKASSRRLVE